MASDGGGEEDFVTYGTPLEPLEEDEPLRKPVPLHEQTVKDEKGRYQRFHGAFTGGFSAGYFNTVGSKEGWTPSTFVSSRQQKADQHLARPEDFMDEEVCGGLSEGGGAKAGGAADGVSVSGLRRARHRPPQITTSREFSSGRRDEAADKARAVGAQAALIPGDLLLEEIITPARSSIGVELLRRMGWREGQGVGPRVKRKARRPQTDDRARVYGCAPPPAGSEEDEEEEEEFAPENVTYAPKDVTPMDFTPKSGLQGLGYRGLDPGLALQGSGAAQHIELFDPQGGARSRLFGDSQGRLRRGGVAGQGFGVGALEDDDEDIYHRDSMSRYDTVLEGEEPGDGLYGWTAPQQYTNKTGRSRDAAYLGKILEGFTLAQSPLEDKEPRPSSSDAVFHAAGGAGGLEGRRPPPQTFRPFEKTPSKQARYDLYLGRLRQGDTDALEQSLDPAMTEWERSRERDEFVRASILYRPASTSLSSRFTRAEHQDDEDTVEVARDQEGDMDDKQAAVKMKMFGKMTRESFEWHPDKLLCKRFNVPDPYPGSGLVGLPKVKRDKFSVFNFLTVTESRQPTAPPKPPDSGKKSRWDVSESKEEAEKKKEDLSEPRGTAKNHAEMEPEPEPEPEPSASETRMEDQDGSAKGDEEEEEEEEQEEQEEEEEEEEEEESRPPMDLFKAIFASSSEEKSSSSEAESNDEEEAADQRDGEEPQNLFSISTGASSSAPPPAPPPASQPSGSSQTKEEEEEVFGPKLPPPSAAVYTGGAAAPRQEDKRKRKRSKEKKPKKSKHKKEKKKKKQKKKKGKQKKSRKESERESSSEDSDPDPDLSADLLLKRLKSIRSQQNR
ncbi:hypothetical protein OJAV_G00027120 [Oryzias javanicus]|uniref:G-patch domain-containing protein n=1 Tax=Oryzias javanicus TaxID=123683 RepID=A0A3S2N6Z0_ORYJA|nr:hypothetical protein OJAV_G00027120 [Oryzias javanicus]